MEITETYKQNKDITCRCLDLYDVNSCLQKQRGLADAGLAGPRAAQKRTREVKNAVDASHTAAALHTGLVGDVPLELVDFFGELFLFVLQLPDLRPKVPWAQVVRPDLVHPLMGRFELGLYSIDAPHNDTQEKHMRRGIFLLVGEAWQHIVGGTSWREQKRGGVVALMITREVVHRKIVDKSQVRN